MPSIYLAGSVALEDFRFGRSDNDIVCFTEKQVTESQAGELVFLRQKLMSEYPENKYYRLFEGVIGAWDAFELFLSSFIYVVF